jgi:hypothetical protein
MMIESDACGLRFPRRAPRPGSCRPASLTAARRRRAAACAALAAVMLAAGCSGGHAAARVVPGTAAQGASPAGSLVRVPRPDYASPASVAAAFYTAWGSVDAQLAAGQPATAAWQAMRRERLVSLVRVTAVTRPDGAPAPTPAAAYLRVYATRVTTTTSGRTTASDGVTLRLSRSGGRWLVSAVLFY